MMISIGHAAQILGISPSLLRSRIEAHRVLKIRVRHPAKVALTDVVAYRATMRPVRVYARHRKPDPLAVLLAKTTKLDQAEQHESLMKWS
jgi:hypothetical protein